MADELLVVQFPHPGGEHGPDASGIKGWNRRGHRRKFLKAPGRWRTTTDLTVADDHGDLAFWGEWEPPSRVVAELPAAGRGYPRYLHEPYWTLPPDLPSLQNTDPYVFGERFRYSNCRQNTKKGPLRTQRLATGSVILFGSGLDGEFVLDTVFVVADAEPLTGKTVSQVRAVDEAFATVTLDLIYPDDGNRTFRLYRGATSTEPVEGMFSFFPCLPYEPTSSGFLRPAIRLDGVVSPRNWRATKMTRVGLLEDAHRVWERVVDQVLDQDLALGVAAATPPHIDKRSHVATAREGEGC